MTCQFKYVRSNKQCVNPPLMSGLCALHKKCKTKKFILANNEVVHIGEVSSDFDDIPHMHIKNPKLKRMELDLQWEQLRLDIELRDEIEELDQEWMQLELVIERTKTKQKEIELKKMKIELVLKKIEMDTKKELRV